MNNLRETDNYWYINANLAEIRYWNKYIYINNEQFLGNENLNPFFIIQYNILKTVLLYSVKIINDTN